MEEALKAINYRLEQLNQMLALMKSKEEEFKLSIPDYESRIDELETLREFLIRKGKN